MDKQVDPFYRTKRWKALRAAVLRRDGYQCQYEKRFGKLRQADTVHHIFPREEYPDIETALWNLVALSAAAHDRMHDRQTGALTKEGRDLMDRTERRQRLLGNPYFKGVSNGGEE